MGTKKLQDAAVQLRQDVSKGLILVIIILLLAFLSWAKWGVGWNLWLPLGMVAYIIFDLVLEFINTKRLKNQNLQKHSEVKHEKYINNVELAPGEFGYYDYDGDDRYGTVVFLDNNVVYIDIRDDSKIEERKRAATKIVNSANEIASSFKEFKNEQVRLQPEYADEILSLTIQLIGLYSKSMPNYGEVYFVDSDSEHFWTCTLINLQFSNLGIEN